MVCSVWVRLVRRGEFVLGMSRQGEVRFGVAGEVKVMCDLRKEKF